MDHKRMYINGEWVESATGKKIEVYNPANQVSLYTIPRGEAEDIDCAVAAAKQAYKGAEWQRIKPYERGRILFKVSEAIRRNQEQIAVMETRDTGKPFSQAKADVESGARCFEFYAGVADKVLGETIPVEPGLIDFTVREPIGVTAHIVPWNYPLQVGARSVAAAIAAGNAVVMKPAEDTPASALKLAELWAEAGLPKGIFNVVTGYGHEAGAALSAHPDVNQITFTGSVDTGTAVMAAASRNVTPVTLELGGKSPNIVFADAPMDEALEWVVRSIVQNSGQTCSAGSRLLIEKSIHSPFVKKVCERMQSLTIGPGLADPDIGPILSEKQFKRIEGYLKLAKEDGVAILVGGKRVVISGAEGGFYLEPSVLDNVNPDSRLANEEIFGPVLTVFTFETEEEAILLANRTPYGLVAGVWTKDVSRAHRLASHIQAGQIFINNYGVGGGVQLPFGGYKKSGFGREKGLEALRNYTQLKNIAIKYQF